MDHFAPYLFLFSIGAFFVPILCRRVHIPSLVGEILYGMLLSFLFHRPGLNLEFIDYLAEMGFIFLMFLAGLELNFDRLNVSSIKFPLLMLAVSYLTGFLLWYNYFPDLDVFFVLLITVTSVGILFLGLKLHGMEQSEYGQSLIWLATLGELLSIFLLILYGVFHKYTGFEFGFVREISSLFILLIIAFLMIRLIMVFLWYFPKSVYPLENDNEKDSSELNVRLALLTMLTMVALTAFFELKIILGAFLGGMMLAFIFRNKKSFEHKLNSIGHGFFIPFFFMKLGWDFIMDDQDMLKIFKAGIELYTIIFIVHFSGAMLLVYHYRHIGLLHSFRNALAAGFLLSAPLSLLVATAKLGQSLHVISQAEYQPIIVSAMLGGLLGPIGFSIFYSKKTDPKIHRDTGILDDIRYRRYS